MKTNHMRHFGRLFGMALLAAGPAAMATPIGVADDFESYTSGTTPPTLDWSTKFEATPSDQQNLFKVQDAIGFGGGKGYSLDVLTAFQNYNSIRQVAVTGGGMIIKSDFQVAIDGGLLTDTPSGVNKGIIGLEVRNSPDWFAGNGFNVNFARRDNGNWGLSVAGAPFITGFQANSTVGLPPAAGAGLAAPAGTSDWFTLQLELTDTGAVSPDPAWTYVAKVLNKSTGATILEEGPFALPATFLTGSTLYGGITSPFTGFTTDRVNTVGKVSAVTADNFSIFGYSTSQDSDNDGLVEFEEAKLGTSDTNPDSDDDGYKDGFEVTNGYDPLNAKSSPSIAFFDDYSAAEGFVDGDLNTQKGWVGQGSLVVDTANSLIAPTGTAGYLRVVKNSDILASTSVADNDVIKMTFDYQFTLPVDPTPETGYPNVGDLTNFGIRPDILQTNWNTAGQFDSTQGVKITHSEFTQTTGGSIKFFPNKFATTNADALIVSGNALGLNTTLASGPLDYESDPLRITYVAECSDSGAGTWNVTGLTVENLQTGLTYTYGINPATGDPETKNPQSFTYTAGAMYFGQQFRTNNQAANGFVDRSGGVIMRYGQMLVDDDSDGLSQAEEVALGTSDGKADTDGDTFSDFAEVNAVPPTDPLNPLSFPGGSAPLPIVITSYTFTGGNTVNISFTSNPSTSFKLTQSETLVPPFTQVGTTSTDGSGVGAFSYVIPPPVPAKNFFRVER